METVIIKQDRSIIPSCDVSSLEELRNMVRQTADVKGVGAYKIGFELGLQFGIPTVVDTIRKITSLPIIYDHQKGATDIPDVAEKFARAVNGVDAVILFPVMGPETQKSFITACKKAKLGVIVGGDMTHPAFLKKEGGYISDDAPLRIYELAASLGIVDFVVPGNKPDKCIEYHDLISKTIKDPIYYSPGLITQGGDINELSSKLKSWHAIIGRAIYESNDMKKAAEEFSKNL